MDSQALSTPNPDQNDLPQQPHGRHLPPRHVSASHSLQLQPTWHLAGQAVAVGEEIDDVQRELCLLPEELQGEAPDRASVLVAAVVPAATAMAVPALAGGDPRWLAAGIAALPLGLAGAGAVWLAQRRATSAHGSSPSGASGIATGLAMAAVTLVVAAAVAWPETIGLDGQTARWLVVAAAAGLLSGWACAGGVAEAAEAAACRASDARIRSERQWRLQQLAGLEATLDSILTALPAAHDAGRGCVAQYERQWARKEQATAGKARAADLGQAN